MTATAAILPPAQPPLQFAKPPKVLSIQIDQGSYRTYCGVVAPTEGECGVLVAISRNSRANSGVFYEPPSLVYLAGISKHEDIKRANVKWRLPNTDDELVALLTPLQATK